MLFGGGAGGNHKPLHLVGAGLTVAWLILIIMFWLLAPDNPDVRIGTVTHIAALIGTFLPFALIWIAVFMGTTIQSLRLESELLRGRLQSLQERGGRQSETPTDLPRPAIPTRPGQPAAKQTQSAQTSPQQVAMQLEAPEEVRITPETLIRALNFPDDANDQQAIAAMRTALKKRELVRVIRAAQDVITLLAEHEITMDGISPDTASVAIWRRFAGGERGKAVAIIGQAQSEIALEIVTTLLRSDEIFRDSAHHFLRHFDQMLARNGSELDDPELEALVDTRSARAFILLGKASGSFGG